jgi:adenylate cyclase
VALTSLDVIASTLGEAPPATLATMSSPEGALTLLLSDVEDAAAIRAALEPDRLAGVLRDQRVLVERIAARHRGVVAKSHEDGFMLAFDSAHAGLRCALDLQRSFAGARAGPAGPPMLLRIGLHTGFVIAGEEDLYGRNVVLAARVAGEARGGEIVVSTKVKEYTETDPGFHFQPLGERHFKGVHSEHEIFAVTSTERRD